MSRVKGFTGLSAENKTETMQKMAARLSQNHHSAKIDQDGIASLTHKDIGSEEWTRPTDETLIKTKRH